MPDPAVESSLERLRHRYRVREIFLDKGILAILIALILALVNARLDDVRASRERQRVVAEREVAAHEEVWRALMKLRRFLAPLREHGWDQPTEAAIHKAVFDFAEAAEGQSLYLAPALERRVSGFVDPALADFLVAWQQSAPGPAPAAEWRKLDAEAEAIGAAIRTEVYKRRDSGPPA